LKRTAGRESGDGKTEAKGAMQVGKGKAQEAVGKLSGTVKKNTR
jgi:uncharacterized protein YjbJ (UPF0337 family)